mmetsp:Transcript_3651/g.5300  ORF Transcript_3651/g.5300 Transcript_3651/m.5300 type:complete len:116 (-) Transcript_3651:1690-2037(-)
MRAFAAVGGAALLSLVLLILSCVFADVWWPLFNVFFFALLLIPFSFGSHESSGVWGGIGDFIEAIFGFSSFAYPIVLYRVDELNGVGLFLAFLSNIVAAGSLYMLFRIAHGESVW